MDWEFATAAGLMSLAMVLLVVMTYLVVRQWRAQKAASATVPDPPWRDGGFPALTSEEKRTVRRAVRGGEVLSDPRLAKAAWRRAEKLLYQQDNPMGSRIQVVNICMQGCVIGSLSVPWNSVPLWAAYVPPAVCLVLALAMLRWSSAGPSTILREAAVEASQGNRAVVEAAGGDEPDTCPPPDTRDHPPQP